MANNRFTPEQEKSFRENPHAFVMFTRKNFEKKYATYSIIGLDRFKKSVNTLNHMIDANVDINHLSKKFKEVAAGEYRSVFIHLNKERSQINPHSLTVDDFLMTSVFMDGLKFHLNFYKPKKCPDQLTEQLFKELDAELMAAGDRLAQYSKAPHTLLQDLARQTQEFYDYRKKFETAQQTIKARLRVVAAGNNSSPSLTQVVPSPTITPPRQDERHSPSSGVKLSQRNFINDMNVAAAEAEAAVAAKRREEEQDQAALAANKSCACVVM